MAASLFACEAQQGFSVIQRRQL